MISFPKAKINIGLRVKQKRPDGFHDIETLFYPVGLSDVLEFGEFCKPESKDHLAVTGLDIGPGDGVNLVLKALDVMREEFTIPILNIHLHKAIPSGAGLGGGSSDAACMLRALQKRFSLPVTDSELRSMALKVGSDSPFFIDPVPSFATGRGEILDPFEPVLKDHFIVIINPAIPISTREAYMNCRPAFPESELRTLVSQPVKTWRQSVSNDFEDYAFRKHPEIREIKDALYRSGAIYSSMSGSGSSVYGIYEAKPKISAILRKSLIWEGFV
jgi:4-diphosphocytidyl-2-C-methyl-D-erythritol kinase